MRLNTLLPVSCLNYLILLPLAMAPAFGQESCINATVLSITSRPTVANATDVTQCGVVEVEYGLERQWPGAGTNRDDLSGGLRIGLARNLDFHWSSAAFLHLMDGAGDRTGFGDSWLGLKYRLLGQTKWRPSVGVFYAAKVPSASAALGLGSGAVDHNISFLASKDITHLHLHLDFNLIELLVGREHMGSFDHNTGLALAFWLPVTRRITLVTEPCGYTLLNQNSPAFASVMAGFNYQVRPRVYLDSGLDVGVTAGSPRKRIFVGVTYAIGNVYLWVHPAWQGTPRAAVQ
jgi:hypothetical protein